MVALRGIWVEEERERITSDDFQPKKPKKSFGNIPYHLPLLLGQFVAGQRARIRSRHHVCLVDHQWHEISSCSWQGEMGSNSASLCDQPDLGTPKSPLPLFLENLPQAPHPGMMFTPPVYGTTK